MIEYWFVFPISVLISTIAMAFGIGGAVMFMRTHTHLLCILVCQMAILRN